MRPVWSSPYRGVAGGETPAVYALLSLMGIAFIVDWLMHDALTALLGWPVSLAWLPTGMLWQPFTFPLVHGANFLYLITDGLVLYFFGSSLERAWGSWKFLFFFLASGVVPGLAVMLLAPWSHALAPYFSGMVGSFLGLVVAFAAMNPFATVLLVIFPIQARWLGVLAVAFELFGRTGYYGGPMSALAAVAATVIFAYAFTTSRISFATLFRRGGPGIRERMERWQQKRRWREWQKRVSRIERPEDLFKDKR